MNNNLFIVHTSLTVGFFQKLSISTSFTNKQSIKGLNFFISWDELLLEKPQVACDILFVPKDFALSPFLLEAFSRKNSVYILNDQQLENPLKIPSDIVKNKSIQVNLKEGLVPDLLLDMGDAYFNRNKNLYESVFENLIQLFEIDVNKEARLELMYLTNNLENIESLLEKQIPSESLIQRKIIEISSQPLIIEALKMMKQNYDDKEVFQKLRSDFHEIVFSKD